jgi:GrpB-like predicted nucleotidyltransferase (UPF0157 family)
VAHDILGLENGPVVLARSNSGWSVTFKSEASDLNSVMKGRVSGIEHVGSTSIPGIRAKPILDIMVGVLNLTDGIELGPVLAELNYELRPNAGLPGELSLQRGRRELTCCTWSSTMVKSGSRSSRFVTRCARILTSR